MDTLIHLLIIPPEDRVPASEESLVENMLGAIVGGLGVVEVKSLGVNTVVVEW